MEVGKISHVDTSRGSYGGSLVGVALGLNSVSCVARSSAATSHIPNAQSGQPWRQAKRPNRPGLAPMVANTCWIVVEHFPTLQIAEWIGSV